jgi:hypothetical protein
MFNYSGLLQKDAEYCNGAFDAEIVTIKDIESYLNNHKYVENEIQAIDPSTNEKVDYHARQQPWRHVYDPRTMEGMWESRFSFILHSPFINNKVKTIVKSVEAYNFVCADAHVYFGKKGSQSFPPHSDDSWNLIIQSVGVTHWRVWNLKTLSSEVLRDLDSEPAMEFQSHPGDALILPKGQIHQAIPLTDRISVSIPFLPGPKTLHRDIKLNWDES